MIIPLISYEPLETLKAVVYFRLQLFSLLTSRDVSGLQLRLQGPEQVRGSSLVKQVVNVPAH
jgi:hypothetical protein